MKMDFGEVIEIEDLGNHPEATVIHLGILLAGTVNATRDPKRRCFYEIEGGSTVYYIYVSPLSGRISLIASWRNATDDLLQRLKSLAPLAKERESCSRALCGS